MIKDFDLVKQQLHDLAGAINEFKSEAVQLRVVELLFQRMGIESKEIRVEKQENELKIKAKSKVKQKGKKIRSKRALKTGRPGPGAIISQLIEEGFFKKPKAVQDIISHCKSKSGYNYKTPELSVGLVRAVRDTALQRTKNAKNQFEYFE